MLGTAAVGDSALIYSFWRGKVPDRCNSTAGEKQTDFWVQLSHEKGWLSGCHSPPSHFFHPFVLQAVVCVYARRWHLELERSWHSKLVSSKRQFVHLEKNPHILYINDYFWLWFCGSRFGNRNQGAINARTVDLSWSKDASNLLLLWRAVRSQCVRSSAERDRGNVAVLHSFCFSPSPGFSPGNCQKRQRSVLCTGAKKLVVLFVPIINKRWQTHLPPGGALVWT